MQDIKDMMYNVHMILLVIHITQSKQFTPQFWLYKSRHRELEQIEVKGISPVCLTKQVLNSRPPWHNLIVREVVDDVKEYKI